MRSEDEIREELSWFDEWGEAEDIEAPCVDTFDSDAYLDGLRYALGEAQGREPVPDAEMVNTLLAKIRDEYPAASVRVERGGYPPRAMDISIRVAAELDDIDEYEQMRESVRALARETEDEYGTEMMIYTHVGQQHP